MNIEELLKKAEELPKKESTRKSKYDEVKAVIETLKKKKYNNTEIAEFLTKETGIKFSSGGISTWEKRNKKSK